MKEEKALTKTNNSIIQRVRNFFKNLFKKKDIDIYEEYIDLGQDVAEDNTTAKKAMDDFNERIKVTETKDMRLENLLTKYRSGGINEEDLTKEEVIELCKLYDKKIDKLRGEVRKKKIELYKIKKGNKDGKN